MAAEADPPATAPSDVGSAQLSEKVLTSQGMTLRNTSALQTRFRTEVHGEVANGTAAVRTLSLKATFYDDSGQIIGAATGIVEDVEPGVMNTFTLTSQ